MAATLETQDGGQTPPSSERRTYEAGSLERALGILTLFSEATPTLSLAEIIVRTGQNKTTAYRPLTVLVRNKFVWRDPISGKYSAGIRSLALASAYKRQLSIIELARPTLQNLRNSLNETAILGIRSGDFRVDVDQAESWHQLRAAVIVGVEKPLYLGVGGRALLSTFSDAELDNYLARTEFSQKTPYTPTDRDDIRNRVIQVREQGFEVTYQEGSVGLVGVATPVLLGAEHPAAALILTIPISRFSDKDRLRALETLLPAAAALRQVS